MEYYIISIKQVKPVKMMKAPFKEQIAYVCRYDIPSTELQLKPFLSSAMQMAIKFNSSKEAQQWMEDNFITLFNNENCYDLNTLSIMKIVHTEEVVKNFWE